MTACLSVCLYAYISQQPLVRTSPNCGACWVWACGSVNSWRHCIIFCSSGFVDDVIFSRHGLPGVDSASRFRLRARTYRETDWRIDRQTHDVADTLNALPTPRRWHLVTKSQQKINWLTWKWTLKFKGSRLNDWQSDVSGYITNLNNFRGELVQNFELDGLHVELHRFSRCNTGVLRRSRRWRRHVIASFVDDGRRVTPWTTTTTTTWGPRLDEVTTTVAVIAGEQRQKTGLVDCVRQLTERFQQRKDLTSLPSRSVVTFLTKPCQDIPYRPNDYQLC